MPQTLLSFILNAKKPSYPPAGAKNSPFGDTSRMGITSSGRENPKNVIASFEGTWRSGKGRNVQIDFCRFVYFRPMDLPRFAYEEGKRRSFKMTKLVSDNHVRKNFPMRYSYYCHKEFLLNPLPTNRPYSMFRPAVAFCFYTYNPEDILSPV